jgi:hypothetical protein
MDKDQEKQEKLDFTNRYFDFWLSFNPGKSISSGLPIIAKKYYMLLASEGVKYKDFDCICTTLEKEWTSLGYEFNLVAYVLDYLRSERECEQQVKDRSHKDPVVLPAKGEEVAPMSPAIAKAMEKLRITHERIVNERGGRDRVDLYPVILRINAKRAKSEIKYIPYNCEACKDTGWVEIEKNSVATCTCFKGQRLCKKDGEQIEFYRDDKKYKVKQATVDECKKAAEINNGHPAILTAVPF